MIAGAVSVGYLHPGNLSSCFVDSLTGVLFHDAQGPRRITSHQWGEIKKEAHAARIHHARNELSHDLLDHSESEWLVIFDADMGFAPDTVERLIASADPAERPIVGGLCFGHKHDGFGDFGTQRRRIVPTLMTMYETDAEVGFVPMLDYPRDELVEVDATGAACLLIHRSVFEKIRDAYGDKWFSLMSVPKGTTGFTEFSEDISFCIRAKSLGIPIYIDTSVKTTHDKGGVFLDEAAYDAQRAARRKSDARFGEWIAATGGLMSQTECRELDYFAGRSTGPVLEVGNYTGLTTIVISNAVRGGVPFYTCDPHGWRETFDEFDANLSRYAGPVASFVGGFEEFLRSYDGDPFTFVFYDGPHSPEYCEAFWSAVVPHLADDAVIAFDDADWSTMNRLTELVSPGRAYLTREPIHRHAIRYSTGNEQVDLDLGKRHPDTYTLAVWGPA